MSADLHLTMDRDLESMDGGEGEGGHLDRRLYCRLPVVCSAKLYDPASRKYVPARTINVSSGGVLLEVRGGLGSIPGEVVRLAIDFTADQPVVGQDEMRSARLVRFERPDGFTGLQRIGLSFVSAGERVAAAA